MKTTSQQIAAQIAKFLEDGGMIEQVPYDTDSENMARVGRWLSLGEEYPAVDESEDPFYEDMDWSDYHSVDFDDY